MSNHRASLAGAQEPDAHDLAIVDCEVHYVDIMCQVTRAKPIAVHAVGARLTDEIAPTMVNYGHLHLAFDDGSVGWYECGWGPMISETAFFVKDMIGPKGCVSIVSKEQTDATVKSSDHDNHTRTNALRIHNAGLKADGSFAHPDEGSNRPRTSQATRTYASASSACSSRQSTARSISASISRTPWTVTSSRRRREHADGRGGEAVTASKETPSLTFATETWPSEPTARAIESELTEHASGLSLRTNSSPRWIIGRDGANTVDQDELVARSSASLNWLSVADPYRKHGVGSQLMAGAEAAARAEGCRAAYLDTFTFQAPKFYERLGF